MPGLQTRLAKAGQQRDQAATENCEIQAEVERLKAEAVKLSMARQVKLVRLADKHGKAITDKDIELKAVVEKSIGLEKKLEDCSRAWALERNGMLCKAQHLDEVLLCKYLSYCPVGL